MLPLMRAADSFLLWMHTIERCMRLDALVRLKQAPECHIIAGEDMLVCINLLSPLTLVSPYTVCSRCCTCMCGSSWPCPEMVRAAGSTASTRAVVARRCHCSSR